MTPDQLQMFLPGRSLLDASIEQRMAAAETVIDTTPTDLAEREELLALVCWPAVWAEVWR